MADDGPAQVYAPLDDVVDVYADIGPDESVWDYTPRECARCMRHGPWRRARHYPTGRKGWLCVRCAEDPDTHVGNAVDWSGLHLWTEERPDDGDA